MNFSTVAWQNDTNFIQQNEIDTAMSESAIITPPHIDLKSSNVKYYRYIIDSRDRNTTLHETPAKYEIELEENITDVCSVEMLLADVPFPRYLIHKNNNLLHVVMSNDISTIYEIIIPVGNYTETTLCNTIQTELNNSELTGFTVHYDSISEKFLFSHISLDFTFKFKGNLFKYNEQRTDFLYKENTIAKVIGFANKDYTSTSTTLTSEYIRNFTKDNYIIMKLEKATINHGKSKNLESSFAIINDKSNTINNVYEHQIRKAFTPAIASINKLKISFKDYDGNYYDFQNQNHRIEILFGTFKQTNKYENIFKSA